MENSSSLAALLSKTQEQERLFSNARQNLTVFMIKYADRVRKATGFGYVDQDVAPSTYEAVCEAMTHSYATHFAYPVWSGGNDNTIYTNREGNLASRFIHDLTHFSKGLDFSLESEFKVAQIIADIIKEAYGAQSLEYRLLMADTTGQALYAETHGGEYPVNQLAFVRSFLNSY